MKPEESQSSSALADHTLHSWQKLGLALKSISPAGYLRFGLILAAAAGLSWVAWQARTALLPFLIGGMIAYILLPLVNSLDRWMPRSLAVMIALTLLLGGLAFIFYILIPPLVRQTPHLLQLIPDRVEIQQAIDRLRLIIQGLPVPTQEAVLKVLQSVSVTLREYLDQNLSGLAGAVAIFLLTIFNSISFILGFLVVPAWLLSVLRDEPRGVRALNRIVPASSQQDFWAILQIIDRPLRAFMGGQFLIALVTGLAVYLSLALLEMIGWPTIQYKVPLAAWAAVFGLIPVIGPYLGALPAVLGGFYRSPQAGLGIIALYVALHYLINRLLGRRIENRLIQIHPAILLVVIVALSELGFVWILVAAPVISILTNLFRYLYGRLSDPPVPAGVLPGQPVPESQTNPETSPSPIPRVYQRSRMARRSSERI
jgi:predicted PurR-regulated permease PerM